jgi:acyl carrier protein
VDVGSDGRPVGDAKDVEGRILGFLHTELLDPGVTASRDDELLAGGLLDSIRVLRLAAYVEEEFRFKMDPADYVIENFQTVAVLAAYVLRAAGPHGEPPTPTP